MKKYVKLIAIIICISLVLVCLSSCTTNANYFTFEPNADETGYIITGTAKILPKSVRLPNSYNGKPVTKATIESKSIEKLTIPKNIEELSLNCSNLSSVKVATDSKHFKVQDEVLYNYNITRVVLVLSIKQGSYYMPRTVIKYYRWALSSANVNAIYVPNEYVQSFRKASGGFGSMLFDIDAAPCSPIPLSNKEITINIESSRNELVQEKLFYEYSNADINWGVAYQP